MNDEGLVRRAAQGDAAAFAQLVRQHQSRLRGFLRRLAKGDASLADDLAQESFLEAWRKLGQFRGEGAFAGWLMRIAWTRYLMEARRRKLEPLEEMDEPRDAPEGLNVEARLDLESAMRKLSPGERAGLTLCYAQGFSNEEASSILDMPPGTLKSHIARGRAKLKALLGDAQ
ncbi:MAG TPA: RNA polymerase sigma factor [Rhizomicrobium sp.]|jgi:RNA polymerase sigma-70 factor (ECF subfamily)|nr:RNA polymerase sigma factor [Rhizomicrobium sp.]